MKELIIFVGIPGIGKSSYYNKHYIDTHLRINLDSLKTRSREWGIFTRAVEYETSIVIDNTNLYVKSRVKYIEHVKNKGYVIKCVVFPHDLELSLSRNKNRDRVVPEQAIRKFYKEKELPTLQEGINEIIYVKEE